MPQWLVTALRPIAEPPVNGRVTQEVSLRLWDSFSMVRSLRALRREGRLTPELEAPASAGASTPPEFDRDFFRQHVLDDLLPFWERSIDDQHGGFILDVDRRGVPGGEGVKSAGMQARMVYSFAAGFELSGEPRYLEAARQGYEFLAEHLWDREHGGWRRNVHRDGQPRESWKWLFDHTYCLTGLTKYHRVSGDQRALEHALKTHEVLDRHALDRELDGYFDSFEHDWRIRSSGKRPSVLMDFLLFLIMRHEDTGEDALLRRIREVADLLVHRARDRRHGCFLETCHRPWRYSPIASGDIASVGHNLKGVWVLLYAHRVLQDASYLRCAQEVAGWSLRHGWDHEHGGLHEYVYRSGRLARREKIWWSQGHGLLALALLHEVSGDEVYADYATRLARFTFGHFSDPDHGEWYTSCWSDGTPKDRRKGWEFKGAYHTTETCEHLHRLWPEGVGPARQRGGSAGVDLGGRAGQRGT